MAVDSNVGLGESWATLFTSHISMSFDILSLKTFLPYTFFLESNPRFIQNPWKKSSAGQRLRLMQTFPWVYTRNISVDKSSMGMSLKFCGTSQSKAYWIGTSNIKWNQIRNYCNHTESSICSKLSVTTYWNLLWIEAETSLVYTHQHPLCISTFLLCLVSQRRTAVPFPLLFFSVCTLQAEDGE